MGDADIKTFKIGSRSSQLALIQTNKIIDDLKKIYPLYQFEIVEISTLGDKILDKPLPEIGAKSLFTKELEEALECKLVDFVVHSLKDLPTTLPKGKVIGAIPEREDARDCVILNKKHKNCTLQTLPKGSVVGTSSLRRKALLKMKHPHLEIADIRGNLNTRLRKLDSGLFDGIILAVAGVKRMGWENKISEILDEKEVLYAVGQGALAVECQENNEEVLSLLAPLMHRETVLSTLAERSFLRKLEGGCSAPVAVYSTLKNNKISLTGLVCSLEGSQMIKETLERKFFKKMNKLNGSGEESSITKASECNFDSENEINTDENETGEPTRKKVCQPKSYCGISLGVPVAISPADMYVSENLGSDLAENMINQDALVIMKEAKEKVNRARS